ncbi:aminotransferase class III-fold pyridoxal phosphate-dependent enzyme [Aurantimonas sp. C2-5-R2]|uniref:aminotransferase class III-fold pyridoxal phosphate-dependent enzyme n=1 Tax=Aurantimonas sp. C2-5-R2 TaxID=3113713 RepID=UPI002F93820F
MTDRKIVIKFEGHYHGWLDSVLVSTATPMEQAGCEDTPCKWLASAGQDPEASVNLEVMSWNRREPLLSRIAKGDVAAVIMEAAMCNSGGIFAEPGYLEAVREACTKSGTVLIFDEVITGFRVAPGGAQSRLGVTPDLAIFAKAIANGFSVAAVAGRADMMDHLGTGRIMHGGTYNAQPIAMAAAIATMDRLCQPATFEALERNGARLKNGIADAFTDAGLTATVTGFPQIFTVALGLTEPARNFRGLARMNRAGYRMFTVALLGNGVRALERGAWFMSTEHDEAVVDETIAIVSQTLVEIAPKIATMKTLSTCGGRDDCHREPDFGRNRPKDRHDENFVNDGANPGQWGGVKSGHGDGRQDARRGPFVRRLSGLGIRSRRSRRFPDRRRRRWPGFAPPFYRTQGSGAGPTTA